MDSLSLGRLIATDCTNSWIENKQHDARTQHSKRKLTMNAHTLCTVLEHNRLDYFCDAAVLFRARELNEVAVLSPANILY